MVKKAIQPVTNPRGFYVMPEINVGRQGVVRVQESSAAVCEGDEAQSGYIWLHVYDAAHHESRQPIEASAHMSHEQAREVAASLLACVKAAESRRG